MAQFNQGLSGNNLPIKYQSEYNKYDTWDGVGDMPYWLKGFIAYTGCKIRRFCREKPVYDAVSDNDPKAIITALRQALTTPSDENIQALAMAAGLTIKKPTPNDEKGLLIAKLKQEIQVLYAENTKKTKTDQNIL